MDSIKTIITFIIVFGVIVLVHEFGHFIFAKRFGILVREFSIGMGPKLFSYRKNETTYTLRILPLGGYVRMAGEGEEELNILPGMPISLVLNEQNEVIKLNTSKKVQLPNSIPFEVIEADLEDKLFIKGLTFGSEEKEVTYSVFYDATVIENDGTEIQIAPKDVQMQSAKLYQRMLTNFAGPMNNFILSFVLFVLYVFMVGGMPMENTNQIGRLVADGAAEKAGLKENDKIISIDDKKISNWSDLTSYVTANPGKKVSVKVEEASKKVKDISLTIASESSENGKKIGKIGVMRPLDTSLSAKLLGGVKLTVESSKTLASGVKDLVTGFSLNKLGGPVMIYKASETAANDGVLSVILMMAMLSMNLGVVNLFPIPALDGGKLILNVIEGIRGKPVSPEKEGIITVAGFAFLMILMVLVTWNDIQRFFF